jgi:putative spermidine/putrescine transport system ATP-binding protein
VDVLNRSAADLLPSGRSVALEIAPEAVRELEG